MISYNRILLHNLNLLHILKVMVSNKFSGKMKKLFDNFN